MFDAVLISLSDGQSYENVKVLIGDDFAKFGIPKVFKQYTGCFFANGDAIILHHWNFKIIKISNDKKTGPNCMSARRLVMSNELIYQDIKIIPQENWENLGIPHLFRSFTNNDGMDGQFSFSDNQGTYITAEPNVASMFVADPRKVGITQSYNKQKILKSSFKGNIQK
jgi:hypothetical protein